ncbi:hypothetical protein HMPREF1705_04758 [Acetomicrobium hydrogeniformans ATCC BAA-1850]|uniref:Uncharacterized protein n=1 Tax=Acetomicrobium hydrogeniformans ATCC BAA-1850 TaxID=592015 RepID=A0A0T5X9S1_9BACT|nr:hypothetical protein HMPREF1705_04758 [Acetomicrobium hydrogeniformans ATCC BAA-1850]
MPVSLLRPMGFSVAPKTYPSISGKFSTSSSLMFFQHNVVIHGRNHGIEPSDLLRPAGALAFQGFPA